MLLIEAFEATGPGFDEIQGNYIAESFRTVEISAVAFVVWFVLRVGQLACRSVLEPRPVSHEMADRIRVLLTSTEVVRINTIGVVSLSILWCRC